MDLLNKEIDTTFQLYINEKRTTADLAVYECGWERCSKDHSFGPSKRDYYLIHYVIKGKGIYHVNDRNYEVNTNDCFLIIPGLTNSYSASKEDPWEYYWVGFHGLEVKKILENCHLLEENFVFRPKNAKDVLDLMKQIKECDKSKKSSQYYMLSKLYGLFAMLVEERDEIKNERELQQKGLVGNVMRYIQENYASNLKVGLIAQKYGINRSHLFRIFKEKMGISLHEYIANVRLSNAVILLKYENTNIKEVSEKVGFIDYGNFLKTFKRKFNVTPKQYKSDPFETTNV